MFTRLFYLASFILVLIAPSLAYAQTASPAIAPWTKTYEARFAEQLGGAASVNDAHAQDDDDKNVDEKSDNKTANKTEIQNLNPDLSVEAEKTPKPSPLETMYSTRAGTMLTQFGYDLFGVPTHDTQSKIDSAAANNSTPPMGQTQDDFILSAGDDLQVVFTGQRSSQKTYGSSVIIVGKSPSFLQLR